MEKSKIELRKWAKDIRKELDIDNLSRIFTEQVRNNEIFKNSQNVMLFYPLQFEINLLDLISENKKFFLPRTNGLNIDVCPYKKGDKLNVGSFGVKEPKTHPVSAKILDLVIVPALLVDKQNYRLGYGKGYYDRLLTHTNAKTLVCIAKELIVEKLPVEKHDKKIDIVLVNK